MEIDGRPLASIVAEALSTLRTRRYLRGNDAAARGFAKDDYDLLREVYICCAEQTRRDGTGVVISATNPQLATFSPRSGQPMKVGRVGGAVMAWKGVIGEGIAAQTRDGRFRVTFHFSGGDTHWFWITAERTTDGEPIVQVREVELAPKVNILDVQYKQLVRDAERAGLGAEVRALIESLYGLKYFLVAAASLAVIGVTVGIAALLDLPAHRREEATMTPTADVCCETRAVRLAWATPPSAAYRIYRDGTLLGTSTATEFVDHTPTPGVVHHYVIERDWPGLLPNVRATFEVRMPRCASPADLQRYDCKPPGLISFTATTRRPAALAGNVNLTKSAVGGDPVTIVAAKPKSIAINDLPTIEIRSNSMCIPCGVLVVASPGRIGARQVRFLLDYGDDVRDELSWRDAIRVTSDAKPPDEDRAKPHLYVMHSPFVGEDLYIMQKLHRFPVTIKGFAVNDEYTVTLTIIDDSPARNGTVIRTVTRTFSLVPRTSVETTEEFTMPVPEVAPATTTGKP